MFEAFRKNLPLIAFCAFFIKCLIFSMGYTEVCMILVLGAIAAIFEYKSNQKKLAELEEKLVLEDKALLILGKKVEDLNTHVASLKMGTAMRSMNIK